ncbi:DNA-binding protein [Streptomyces orinoci]|uniref:Tetratricopeptide repeat protein n=1 Tax=Streptomyces orinoci TaxID=67339 RepID=A0ABV3JU08_STRON|nr:DNA-binding protein [Streptomyces orinoci]
MAENSSTHDIPARGPADFAPRLALARRILTTGAAEDAAAAFRDLHREAAEHHLVAEQAAALQGLGDCALETGELAAARDHFAGAELLLAEQPLAHRVPALRGRATAHLLAGELRYACHLLQTAIEELSASGPHDPGVLLALHTAAIGPYMDMGAYARAAHAAQLALALAPEVDEPALVAGTHRAVARTLVAEGRIAEADRSLAKAQELYEQLSIRTELAHCHWMRGYVHAQEGNLATAERELRTAREILAAKRAALFTGQVEVELADVLRRRGKTAEAVELLRPLLAPSALGDERGAVHAGGAHRLLGIMAEERGDTEAAEEHYCAALSLLERTGAAGDLADLCRLLGDLLRRGGRIEAALGAYRTGLGHRAAPGTTTLGPC